MKHSLDRLDVRILDVIQNDATLPAAEIAERVASSKTVVWRRIQRMVDDGVIRSRVAVLEHRKVGLGVMVFAHIKMSRHNRNALPTFLDSIRQLPQVVECHTLMGNVDFLLKVMMPSVEEYEHFVWHKLSQIEGVQEINSSISMSQPIYSTRLPVSPTD